MKNLKTLLTMAIVALMSLSFTSCDEDADIGDTLYGTWKGYMDIGLTYGDHYYASTISEITFVPSNSYSDHGKGYWIDRYSNAPWDYVANHIEWAVSNGVIKIRFVEKTRMLRFITILWMMIISMERLNVEIAAQISDW